MSRYSLLDEPLFSIRVEGEPTQADLPGILEALGQAEHVEFEALRPHQQQPWYTFCVQLAAIVLHRAGEARPTHSGDWWRAKLLEATNGDTQPWHLLVEDRTSPAFLQPPAEEDWAGYRIRWETPDAVDSLIDPRRHDSRPVVEATRAEHWIYSLVALQTTGGYVKGHYPISRISSGYSARPLVAMAPGMAWPERWKRDVHVLLETREEAVRAGFAEEGGIALAWLEPWDGEQSLSLAACDPYIIEVCRRLRSIWKDDRIEFRCASAKAMRLDAKERKGDVGDPWTPIRREDHAALNPRNFDYKRVCELLRSDEYTTPAALRLQDGDHYFFATVLARGQGSTEGVHERLVHLPARVRSLLSSREGRDRISRRSKTMAETADTVSRKILFRALKELEADTRLGDRLKAWVDQEFFAQLWGDLELPDEEADPRWAAEVLRSARQVLEVAIRSAGMPASQRLKRVARAEHVFEGAWRRLFPDAIAEERRGAV